MLTETSSRLANIVSGFLLIWVGMYVVGAVQLLLGLTPAWWRTCSYSFELIYIYIKVNKKTVYTNVYSLVKKGQQNYYSLVQNSMYKLIQSSIKWSVQTMKFYFKTVYTNLYSLLQNGMYKLVQSRSKQYVQSRSHCSLVQNAINRPGVAGAVLQSPPSLINSFIQWLMVCGNIFITLYTFNNPSFPNCKS